MVGALSSTAAKYMRVIIGYPRVDDVASEASMPTLGSSIASPDLKTFKVKEDFNCPIGGTSGAVDTSIPGIIKFIKIFKLNERLTWPNDSDSSAALPQELKKIP